MRIYPRKYSKRVVWYIDFRNEKGQRIRKMAGTRKQAELALAKIRTALYEKRFDIIPGREKNIGLLSFVDRYFQWADSTHRAVTVKHDRSRLIGIMRFFEKRGISTLNQITIGLMQEFQAEYLNAHSRKSWNNVLSLIKSILNRAIDWELIASNPLARLKPLKIDKTFHFFSVEEVKKIIRGAPEPLKTVIIMLVHTGMRRSELWHLRWQDVDLYAGIIRIKPYRGYSTKSRRSRSIPMTPGVNEVIKKLKGQKQQYVCRPYQNIHTMRKEFKKLLRGLGLQGTLHDLRHTFASHLAMSGAPMPAIKELLGHSDIRTTMIYSHLLPEAQKAAIEKLPF